jgi:hypothetical protein
MTSCVGNDHLSGVEDFVYSNDLLTMATLCAVIGCVRNRLFVTMLQLCSAKYKIQLLALFLPVYGVQYYGGDDR